MNAGTSLRFGCGSAASYASASIASSAVTTSGVSDRKSTRLNSSHRYNSYSLFLFFKRHGDHRDLPSFPTRRSSDLTVWLRIRRVIRLGVYCVIRCYHIWCFRSEEHTSELQSPLQLLFPLFVF